MRSYRTIGLDLHEWQILEQAKALLPVLEVMGRTPTDSEVMTMLVRHGYIRLALMDEEKKQNSLIGAMELRE